MLIKKFNKNYFITMLIVIAMSSVFLPIASTGEVADYVFTAPFKTAIGIVALTLFFTFFLGWHPSQTKKTIDIKLILLMIIIMCLMAGARIYFDEREGTNAPQSRQELAQIQIPEKIPGNRLSS